jgi:hypothetical protein
MSKSWEFRAARMLRRITTSGRRYRRHRGAQMTEDWTFRGAIFSISQKRCAEDENSTAKAEQRLLDMLRADYPLTAADKAALADYIEGKHDRPVGRPHRNFFDPVHKGVRLIRAKQERHLFKRATAVEEYKRDLQLIMGEKSGATYRSQIMAELRRAKPRKKS